MIFYRYQNTKTMETNSKNYDDMKLLYNKVVYERDFVKKDESLDLNYCVDKFYPIFSEELFLRKGVNENICKQIIRTISKIALESELPNLSLEEKERDRKKAFMQIDFFMEKYPFDGIFVIPEYSEECKFGTKYSVMEMMNKIVCHTSTPNVNYLASYSGVVVKKEMSLGGTLIKPRKLLGVRTVFDNSNKNNKIKKGLRDTIFYRDIDDDKKLVKLIEHNKNLLDRYSDNFKGNNLSRNIVISHTRELLIRKVLEISNANYKNLDYRFMRDRHLIEVTNKNKLYKFCIYNKDVTVNNILNGDLIEYDGFFIEDDLFNNVTNKKILNLELVV